MRTKLKAFVRYDGVGRIIPGSVILAKQAPKVGNWQEIPANECCNPTTTTTAIPEERFLLSVMGGEIAPRFYLTWDSFANTPVEDNNNVYQWNEFFSILTDNPGYYFTDVNLYPNLDDMGPTVELIGMIPNSLEISSSLFENNDHLTGIIDLDGIIGYVGNSAFSTITGNTKLQYITLNGVTSAGQNAFYGTRAQTVKMPLLEFADAGCFSSTCTHNFNFPSLTEAGAGCFDNWSGGEGACSPGIFTISAPLLATIGIGCFYGCNYCVGFDLPSLTSIPQMGFHYCWSAEYFNAPLVTSIGYGGLRNCKLVKQFNFPLVETVADAAFYDCKAVEMVNLQACTALGSTVGFNNVFGGIADQTVTLVVLTELMTCNTGAPDGDITDLNSNNTLTIIEV